MQDLPQPLRRVSPVLATIVTPEPMGVPPARPLLPVRVPGADEAYLLKVAPDLRDLAAGEGAARPTRMQLILNYDPAFDDAGWALALSRAVPGIVIEGRLGEFVTVLARPRDAGSLAQVPRVSVVRLPWPAAIPLRAPDTVRPDPAAVTLDRALDALYRQGKRGQKVRVAIIDSDFRGYDQLVKDRRLPARTRYVDLTAERNRTVEPDAFPSRAGTVGHGAQCAVALAMAAPECELTLIRIDPASPQQFQEAARIIHGGVAYTDALTQRRTQLQDERRDLDDRLARLQDDRKDVLGRFVDRGEKAALEKRPESELLPEERERLEDIRRLEAYERRQKQYDRDERAYDGRLGRYTRLLSALQGLRGIRIVSSSLTWNDGYPLGGSSPLSRYFDSQVWPTLWFQAAGDTRGQAWTGLFRDHDGNGVMEFTPVNAGHPETWWRAELSFLAWKPFGAAQTPTLPARSRIRLSIQWREVHDPEFWARGEDLYLRPLANLRLVVVRQRDPSGRLLPTDDFELIARSQGLPQRLDNQPDSAVYEQTVEFSVDPAGHYALRVEGAAPRGTRPADVPSLPGVESNWELRPRIFVDAADPASRLAGRPVFEDWRTDAGTIGTPGDAHQVITVGAADFAGKPETSSASGPPAGLGLMVKPDVLAYNRLLLNVRTPDLAYGTSVATPFAAGLVAVRVGTGVPAAAVGCGIQRRPAEVMPVK
jgi:hypothetical protein